MKKIIVEAKILSFKISKNKSVGNMKWEYISNRQYFNIIISRYLQSIEAVNQKN